MRPKPGSLPLTRDLRASFTRLAPPLRGIKCPRALEHLGQFFRYDGELCQLIASTQLHEAATVKARTNLSGLMAQSGLRRMTLSLAFLDMCGHLDTLKRREMLDVLDEAGVGGYENRIADVKYLDKRIVEYKSMQQGFLRLSTP